MPLEIGEVVVVVNIIAVVPAQLVEQNKETQHNKVFVGVLRHFLVPGADHIALRFGGLYSIQR